MFYQCRHMFCVTLTSAHLAENAIHEIIMENVSLISLTWQQSCFLLWQNTFKTIFNIIENFFLSIFSVVNETHSLLLQTWKKPDPDKYSLFWLHWNPQRKTSCFKKITWSPYSHIISTQPLLLTQQRKNSFDCIAL